MKKLDQFILKSFVGPFIAILLVVVFILVMQFLWLYIDELVGKGLSFKVILEFLGWGSVTMLPLSLPLATLLASMMTLGTLGENNELLAIKAAGISLQRVMIPLGICCVAISIGAFFISNDLIPVAYKKKKVNELYVDVFERLNVMLNLQGEPLSQSVDGSITMRSYLSGCPPVRMLLAQNLLVGKNTPIPVVQDETGRTLTEDDFIIVDDMNFHECMKLQDFESQRMLYFNPPEGEFTAINYRITTSFRSPFVIRPLVEEKSETKIELILQVRTEFEADVEAKDVFISLHTPHDTTTCSVTLAPNAVGQKKEYREKEHRVLWMINKVTGQKEYFLKVVFNLSKPANQFITKEIGPVA